MSLAIIRKTVGQISRILGILSDQVSDIHSIEALRLD